MEKQPTNRTADLNFAAVSDEDIENFFRMHAMGANTAGQLGSGIPGGVLLAIVTRLL